MLLFTLASERAGERCLDSINSMIYSHITCSGGHDVHIGFILILSEKAIEKF